MGDTIKSKPDHRCLFDTANGQHGHFTSAQANACGFTPSLLSHQTKASKYVRVRRGLYRLRDYPWFYREHVVAAWLAVGKDGSVVSHESALDLLELSDVIPNATHLTVPRTRRNLPDLSGVRIHTTTRSFGPLDVVQHEGIRVTSATRTILDAAETGSGPEQIEMAIWQALDRGLAVKARLIEAASTRSGRVRRLVVGAVKLYEARSSS
jgi:predicted transcriptional regulator of viral defense system